MSAKEVVASGAELARSELEKGPPLDVVELTPEIVERIVRQAKLRQDAFNKLLVVALAGTRPEGWMNFGENPWPSTPEAERIRRDFGISIIDPQLTMEEGVDDRGPWYAYTVIGTVTHPLFGTIVCTGNAGSRDNFFAKAGDTWKPASDIDRPSVKQSAYSNLVQNGVTRILGLRGLTWDELAQMSGGRVTKERSQSVSFKSKKDAATAAAATTAAPAAQNGVPGYVVRLEEMLQKIDVQDVRKVLQGLTAFPGKDGKSDFPGFNSMSGLRASKNPEYMAKLAYDKLRELVDQGGFKLKQAAAKDEAVPSSPPGPAVPSISPPPPAQVYTDKATQMSLDAEKKADPHGH